MSDQTPLPEVAEQSKSEDGDANAPQEEEWEVNRDHHKSLADEAFRSADYKTAIKEYSNAITFDPEFHILYSNRSAAYLANGEKSRALVDAKKCIDIKPDFVKGHSRLASSMLSLGRWNEARSVYRHILSNLDKDSAVAKKGIEDCRIREQKANEAEREMILRRVQEAKENLDEETAEGKAKGPAPTDTTVEKSGKGDDEEDDEEDDEDDLLGDFFDEVEEVTTKNQNPQKVEEKAKEEVKENKIQIQVKDLGDFQTQIDRLLKPNHEWYNLNPFQVLDISYKAPLDLLSRRYKALSLMLHPDKVRTSSNSDKVDKAEEAFEYVRKAMNSLKDEDKAKHYRDLVEQGMKQGKRDFDAAATAMNKESLESCQEKATMKIFAEIERRRRDVERRKRNQEKRERDQEDAEVNKMKKERDFEKSWKEGTRVDKRVGNWRDFSSKGNKRTKR